MDDTRYQWLTRFLHLRPFSAGQHRLEHVIRREQEFFRKVVCKPDAQPLLDQK